MKPLRLVALACLGSLVLGVAIALSAGLAYPAERTLRGVLTWLAIGSSMGLLLFLPMAVLEALRPTLARWLRPYAFPIQWYASLAMALTMGYILASVRHAAFDPIAIVAGFVVWLGAWTKLGLWVIFRPSE
jgi:hypothetical protein